MKCFVDGEYHIHHVTTGKYRDSITGIRTARLVNGFVDEREPDKSDGIDEPVLQPSSPNAEPEDFSSAPRIFNSGGWFFRFTY